MRALFRFLIKIIGVLLLLLAIGAVWFYFAVRSEDPITKSDDMIVPPRTLDDEGRWRVGKDWLGREKHGMYEAYIQGDDLERGLAYSAIANELIARQEDIFVQRIRALVPDEGKLGYLKYFVAWFDRGLDEHVPLEYRREIYGVSRAMPDRNDIVGPKYQRALNYHAAHDIGHALQDLAMVGCTSFAAWDKHTSDGGLLVARNFDFYLGEDFACEKLVLFVRPAEGIPFMTIGWGGFMGAVSGMNLEGLTVTLNAARSKVPFGAKTPISLLARDIVQHASTIDQAVAIARSHEVFVSESILVSSAKDHRAVIIEKAPEGMDVFTPDGDLLICANHYQSARFKDSPENLANIRESDSMARFRRMSELTSTSGALDPVKAVRILRDRSGPDSSDVGMGDPTSLNQLLAHHSIVFQPEKRLVWISTEPYQLGAFVCYDLNSVFARSAAGMTGPAAVDSLSIPADPFLGSPSMTDFVLYRETRAMIVDHLLAGTPLHLGRSEEEAFIRSNPKCYLTYVALGDMHRTNGEKKEAAGWYAQSLALPVSSLSERNKIEDHLKACATN